MNRRVAALILLGLAALVAGTAYITSDSGIMGRAGIKPPKK